MIIIFDTGVDRVKKEQPVLINSWDFYSLIVSISEYKNESTYLSNNIKNYFP